jgi:hypothetical protein
MNARLDAFKEELIGRIEDATGQPVSYSRIAPSILRYVQISDLRLGDSDTAPVLEVQRLRVHYSIVSILRGEFSEAVREVRVENSSVFIDPTRHEELIDGLRGMSGGDGGGPVGSLQVGGRNVNIVFTEDGRMASADRCFFDVELSPDVYEVSFRGELMLEDPAFGPLEFVSARVETRGSVSPDFQWANAQVTLEEARTRLFSVGTQEFQLDLTDDRVHLRRIRGREPVDIGVSVDRSSGTLNGQILADGFDPTDVVEFSGALESVRDQLPSDLTGSVRFDLSTVDDEVEYELVLDTRFEHPGVEGPVSFAGLVEGDRRYASFNDFGLTTNYGFAQYTGDIELATLLPHGRISVRNAAVGDMAPVSGRFDLRREDGALFVLSEGFTYSEVGIQNLTAYIRPDPNSSPLAVEADLVGAGSLSIRGTLNRGESTGIQVSVETDDLGVVEVLRLYQGAVGPSGVPIDLVASYDPEVTAVATVWTDFSDLLVELPRATAISRRNPQDRVEIEGVLSSDRLEVDHVVVSLAGYEGSGRAVAVQTDSGVLEFQSDFEIEGIEYALTGEYRRDRRLLIEGLYGVDARFYTPPGRSTQFRVATGEIPIPTAPDREPASLSFDVDGSFRNVSEWEAVLRSLSVKRLPLPEENTATLLLSGILGPDGGTLDQVRFEDELSVVEGAGEVGLQLEEEIGVSTAIIVGAVDGEETYELSVAYRNREVSGSLRFSESPVARLGFQALKGDVSGDIGVSGPLDRVVASVDVALPDGRFNADPISGFLRATIGRRELTIDDLEIGYLTTQIQDASARVDFQERTMTAEARYVQLAETQEADVAVDLNALFVERPGEFGVGDLPERGFTAAVELRNLPTRNGGPSEWSVRFERDESGLRVAGGPDDSIRGFFGESGAFDLRMVSPLPVAFSAEGSIVAGQVEANLNRLRANLEELPGLTDLGVVRFLTGEATGSVRIVGPINDPDFYGTLVVTDTSTEVDLIPEVVTAEKGYLVFQEKVMRLVPFQATAGAAVAEMEGEFLFNRWGIEEYRLLIDAPTDPGLHIAYDFSAVEVDGFALGQIEITGNAGAVRFDGRLTAQSTAITLSEETVEEPESGETAETIVDLTIETGKGIEFFWPTNNFPILRAFAETGETIEIDYSSIDGSFALRGNVGIQGGELFYFDRNFYVRSGSIRFREDETEFDPQLTISAEIRDVSSEGPVRIYLSAEDSPLSEFSPRFSSDPPLNEMEIMAILGGNILATDGSEQLDLSQAVILTSDIVTQFGVVRSIESSVRRALGLDLFTVRTHLFPNLIRGAIEDATYPLDNPSPSLGKYLDNTTIFLGKYLGTDLFLELLVQLRAENPLETDVRDLGGLSVDSEFSLEWKTPFFLLEWNFFPRTPEDLFLTDNTFVFSWEYSF